MSPIPMLTNSYAFFLDVDSAEPPGNHPFATVLPEASLHLTSTAAAVSGSLKLLPVSI